MRRLKSFLLLFVLISCEDQKKEATNTDKKGPVQIGDPGWHFDSSRFDPDFPDMKEWAKAGVQEGIPYKKDPENKIILQPGDNLQKAINKIAKKDGGVVLLKKGKYVIDTAIHLRSNVVIRGKNRKKTQIVSHQTGQFTPDSIEINFFSINTGAINFKEINNAGVENLTILYGTPDFEPVDKNKYKAEWSDDVFINNPKGRKDLYVTLINIIRSKNCWVDDCRILRSGTDPVVIYNSEHITCRNNFIDRCYNKGGGGNGYYTITKDSEYNLIYNDTVRRIRHFAVRSGAAYNVIYKCNFQVDINFHDGDDGHNLVEKNKVMIPVWHSWHPFQLGVSNKHRPPGPNNFIYDNKTDYKNRGPEYNGDNYVFEVNTDWKEDKSVDTLKKVPKHGTLFAIKR